MSCDLKPSEIPSTHHYQGDVFELLKGQQFDLLIAHPPCTDLAISGARWFPEKVADGRQQKAIDFFTKLALLDIPKIAIENPISIMSTEWRKPDQIIHPWMFGESYSKSTCLWLKGLPKLVPTNIVDKGEFVIHGGKKIAKWYSNREMDRDKTFQGIADAMASQWG
jgi:site-specific DNA-cytosine methylase